MLKLLIGFALGYYLYEVKDYLAAKLQELRKWL